MRMLEEKGARIEYADPYVPQLALGDTKLLSMPLTSTTLHGIDCAVIVTDHALFDYVTIVREAPAVVDVRNALRGAREGREKIVTL
jgi:UDP-N-acetyl-D-glucosamine dehydrogenase